MNLMFHSELFKVPLQDQIACAKRELAMRQRVYPRWVSNGKMKQEKADHEIEAMEQIIKTLEFVSALSPK